jgi:hypothetical protein
MKLIKSTRCEQSPRVPSEFFVGPGIDEELVESEIAEFADVRIRVDDRTRDPCQGWSVDTSPRRIA